MSMNIWILQHYATPPDMPSGTRHFTFAKQLVQRGHSVSIWASGLNHGTFKEERLSGTQLLRTETIEGVAFIWVRTTPYSRNDWRRMANITSYSVLVAAAGALKRRKPDVIWASNPHLFSGLSGYLLAKKTGARFVFEVRDLWPQIFVDMGVYPSKHPMIVGLRKIEKFIYNKAERVISPMSLMPEYIASLGIGRQKAVHIPHGINFVIFNNTSVQLPEKISTCIGRIKREKKTIIGYAGAHGKADALDTIVDAARILADAGVDNIHFILVGHGTEKDRLVDLTKQYNLENINFFDSIPKNSIPTLLDSYDVCIVCKESHLRSYGAGFIKTYDYMARGKPVIWAAYDEDNPVRRSGCGWEVVPENPGQLAEATKKFAKLSLEELVRIGEKGFEYVKKYNDHDRLTDILEAVLMGEKDIPSILYCPVSEVLCSDIKN